MRYSHHAKLESAVNDEQKIAELLRIKYNFKTEIVTDATKNTIIKSLFHYTDSEHSKRRLKDNDNFLLYYAGHGEIDEKDRQNAFWIPVDGEPENIKSKIDITVIKSYIEIMKAKKVIVIADTCFSGILTKSIIPIQDPETSRYEWLQKLAHERSRVVISSGGLKPILDKGIGEHSVFADALIDILETNSEVIEARQLHEEIYPTVSSVSAHFGLLQEPQFGAVVNAGHNKGDFLFVPGTSQYYQAGTLPSDIVTKIHHHVTSLY